MNLRVFNQLLRQYPFILIDFYADWCEPCKHLDKILIDMQKINSGKYHIEKIDIEKSPSLKEEFSIVSVPQLFFYIHSELKWRYSGFMTAKAMHENIISLIEIDKKI